MPFHGGLLVGLLDVRLIRLRAGHGSTNQQRMCDAPPPEASRLWEPRCPEPGVVFSTLCVPDECRGEDSGRQRIMAIAWQTKGVPQKGATCVRSQHPTHIRSWARQSHRSSLGNPHSEENGDGEEASRPWIDPRVWHSSPSPWHSRVSPASTLAGFSTVDDSVVRPKTYSDPVLSRSSVPCQCYRLYPSRLRSNTKTFLLLLHNRISEENSIDGFERRW